MRYLVILLFLLIAPTWGLESLLGLDLHVEHEGQHVQFGIAPAVFEQVTDYLETHPTQHFFVEDGVGTRYKGTVTRMSIVLAPKRVLFAGILDQPLSSLDQNMKVYLNMR